MDTPKRLGDDNRISLALKSARQTTFAARRTTSAPRRLDAPPRTMRQSSMTQAYPSLRGTIEEEGTATDDDERERAQSFKRQKATGNSKPKSNTRVPKIAFLPPKKRSRGSAPAIGDDGILDDDHYTPSNLGSRKSKKAKTAASTTTNSKSADNSLTQLHGFDWNSAQGLFSLLDSQDEVDNALPELPQIPTNQFRPRRRGQTRSRGASAILQDDREPSPSIPNSSSQARAGIEPRDPYKQSQDDKIGLMVATPRSARHRSPEIPCSQPSSSKSLSTQATPIRHVSQFLDRSPLKDRSTNVRFESPRRTKSLRGDLSVSGGPGSMSPGRLTFVPAEPINLFPNSQENVGLPSPTKSSLAWAQDDQATDVESEWEEGDAVAEEDFVGDMSDTQIYKSTPREPMIKAPSSASLTQLEKHLVDSNSHGEQAKLLQRIHLARMRARRKPASRLSVVPENREVDAITLPVEDTPDSPRDALQRAAMSHSPPPRLARKIIVGDSDDEEYDPEDRDFSDDFHEDDLMRSAPIGTDGISYDEEKVFDQNDNHILEGEDDPGDNAIQVDESEPDDLALWQTYDPTKDALDRDASRFFEPQTQPLSKVDIGGNGEEDPHDHENMDFNVHMNPGSHHDDSNGIAKDYEANAPEVEPSEIVLESQGAIESLPIASTLEDRSARIGGTERPNVLRTNEETPSHCTSSNDASVPAKLSLAETWQREGAQILVTSSQSPRKDVLGDDGPKEISRFQAQGPGHEDEQYKRHCLTPSRMNEQYENSKVLVPSSPLPVGISPSQVSTVLPTQASTFTGDDHIIAEDDAVEDETSSSPQHEQKLQPNPSSPIQGGNEDESVPTSPHSPPHLRSSQRPNHGKADVDDGFALLDGEEDDEQEDLDRILIPPASTTSKESQGVPQQQYSMFSTDSSLPQPPGFSPLAKKGEEPAAWDKTQLTNMEDYSLPPPPPMSSARDGSQS